MCRSVVDIQSPTAEIRRGKKKKEEEEQTTAWKYNGLPYYIGRPQKCGRKQSKLEMWANAKRDGRRDEYRWGWRTLFNAAKFGWRPVLECRAVTLPRCETRWNLQGCPKLANRSQPLVRRSSPYCEDMWSRYCCLISFFSDCPYVPYLRRCSPTDLCDGAETAIFCVLYSISEPRAVHFRPAF